MRKKSEPPFVKNCPKCGKEQKYTTVKRRNRFEKLGKCCKKCSAIEVGSRPEYRAKRSEIAKKRIGKLNSFYGKHHSDETKAKLRSADRSYTQSEEFRKNSARHGKQNGMYQKTIYDVWVAKYGEEEARRKFAELKKLQSYNTSGEKNPMFGKPAPNGSGGGWSGWYKNWYFRSLRELSYMLRVIEHNGFEWESAETKDFEIPYVNHDGKQRTYRADFVVNGEWLVEVKPKALMDTPNNKLKKEAAKAFCLARGLRYKMVDVKLVALEILISISESGLLKFVPKYEERFKEYVRKHRNDN